MCWANPSTTTTFNIILFLLHQYPRFLELNGGIDLLLLFNAGNEDTLDEEALCDHEQTSFFNRFVLRRCVNKSHRQNEGKKLFEPGPESNRQATGRKSGLSDHQQAG